MKNNHTKGKLKVQLNQSLKAHVNIVAGTGKKVARTMFGNYNKKEAEANAERIVKAVNILSEIERQVIELKKLKKKGEAMECEKTELLILEGLLK